jgi:hypothetical protein
MTIGHIRLVNVIYEATKMLLVQINLLRRQFSQTLLIGSQLVWIQFNVHVEVSH